MKVSSRFQKNRKKQKHGACPVVFWMDHRTNLQRKRVYTSFSIFLFFFLFCKPLLTSSCNNVNCDFKLQIIGKYLYLQLFCINPFYHSSLPRWLDRKDLRTRGDNADTRSSTLPRSVVIFFALLVPWLSAAGSPWHIPASPKQNMCLISAKFR